MLIKGSIWTRVHPDCMVTGNYKEGIRILLYSLFDKIRHYFIHIPVVAQLNSQFMWVLGVRYQFPHLCFFLCHIKSLCR